MNDRDVVTLLEKSEILADICTATDILDRCCKRLNRFSKKSKKQGLLFMKLFSTKEQAKEVALAISEEIQKCLKQNK